MLLNGVPYGYRVVDGKKIKLKGNSLSRERFLFD